MTEQKDKFKLSLIKEKKKELKHQKGIYQLKEENVDMEDDLIKNGLKF